MERSLEYDLDFFYNQPRIFVTNYYLNEFPEVIESNIINFAKKYNRFYIYIHHETIRDQELLDRINNIISNYNSNGFEIYLLMTTSTTHPNYLHPLCNCFQYKPHIDTIYKKEINLDKSIKGILSVRRRNQERDLFFKKYKKPFDGILNYLKVNLNEDTIESKEAPSDSDFLDLMRKSFVFFCFESDTIESLNSFTEKTILMFLSKNLPILFLKNNSHLKELEDMGFYLLNREFGYIDVGDTLEDKVDEFIKCVDMYNSLSVEDINLIYRNNIDKIEKNYKIITEILFSENKFNKQKESIELIKTPI